MISKWVAIVWLVITGTIFAATKTSEQETVAALLKPLADRNLFSGSVVVTRNGGIVAEQHIGLANRELDVPIRPSSRFYVASVTKSFTAAAIFMLRERGAISLEDPISKFIPGFPHGEITVRQLLTHSSGFQHPVFYSDYYDLAKRSYTTAEVVDLFKDRPVIAPPGTRQRYSDYNYVILARIIEIASGKKYGEFLRDGIFVPQQLTTAGNHTGWAQIVPNRADGYQPVGMKDFENARFFDYSISTGAGSLYMSARDLSRWITALATGRVLGTESTRELLGEGDHSGLIGSRTIAGHHAVALNGWDNIGFAAEALYFPDAHLSVAVTTNINDSGVAGYVSESIAQGILTGKKVEPPHFLEHAKDVDRLVGMYRLGSDFYVPGQQIELVQQGDQLYERQKNPDRLMGLVPLADGSFIYRSHWSQLTFQEQGGKVESLTFDGFKAIKVR